VLLVDDEAPLLRLLENFLTRNGYDTEAYNNPVEALARFEADPAAFTLVVADVTMPALSGVEMVRRLSDLSADVRILLLSGFPFSTDRLPEPIRRRVGFLQKPFVPNMLLEAVQELERRTSLYQRTSDSAC